jgi:hypothetical protein
MQSFSLLKKLAIFPQVLSKNAPVLTGGSEIRVGNPKIASTFLF